MRCKGQVEIIVIVALLAVIAVVVVTQMNNFVLPSESPDVRNVRESTEGLIREAMLSTMDTMADKGGYLSESDYQLGSVTLNGKEVPYWQYRGEVTYPDLVSNFQAGVQAYLAENKDSFAQALADVNYGTPVVNIPTFTQDSVTLTVNMPTTYKETPLSQPFSVTLQSGFGQVNEFAKAFAVYEAQNRPLEYYTMSSIMLSPVDNGHRTIPVYETLVGCGDYIFASSWDVIPDVETQIKKTLGHTYMPGKVPENTLDTSSSPKYTLVPLNGKSYEDLKVSFMLPDEFSLDYSNFRMSPDPVFGMAEPIPLMGDCIGTEAVKASYTINYPVIVRALDPDTGSVFQYAIDVYIADNLPAPWNVQTPLDTQEDDICQDPSCIAELTVTDSSGQPLEGASAHFMGCYLGTTDSSGYLATLAPCGAGTLAVDKRGYGSLLESRSSSDISGEVTLYGNPQVNVILHEVVVQDQGSGQYMIYYGDINPISGKRAFLNFRSGTTGEQYSYYPGSASITLSNIPRGGYYMFANLATQDFQTNLGGTAYPVFLDEGAQNLHIYIPTTAGFGSIPTETGQLDKVADLLEVLVECGIEPASETPFNQEEACSVTIA